MQGAFFLYQSCQRSNNVCSVMSTATAVDYRDEEFARSVASFYVDIDATDLNAMQQDGATAIVDLAG
ncbi:MAG: hypothetical protein ACO3AC_05435, partial [Hylemonella sp.]